MRIGVLAVQGDYAKHHSMLLQMGLKTRLVRTDADLAGCDALIIPGGESTTMTTVMQKHGLWQPVIEFGRQKPIMGTCAGLILLATEVPDHGLPTLGLLDVAVIRNAYGRQVDSFVDQVTLDLNGKLNKYTGVFIRAPKISRSGANVKILGYHQQDIVMVETEHILACTFHPELTEDDAIHRYFHTKTSKLIGC
ncbi:pyridoxal 5'-phosphate synthase glutaminase subunit PdxT [candidate division KSB1 bacterium]|nr:pyridoxal 5'-phosphate synthase glutaminase subunit PdxT [candidate division KSB1 bacterium]